MDTETQVLDPNVNPDQAALAAAQVLAAAEAPPASDPADPPLMEAARDAHLTLPCGFQAESGELITTASVRELNGADEERISRIREPWQLKDTLLTCGLERLGDSKPTTDLVRQLTVGDREYLLLQIRIATYGKEMDFDIVCPDCSKEETVVLDLTEVETKTFSSPNEATFQVELSGGAVATVALPTGTEEVESLKKETKGATISEVNTYMLSQCVLDVTGHDLWLGAESAKNLGLRDRKTLVSAILGGQPGPNYEEVKYECDCGFTSPLPLSLLDLFRG